jgi:hypothetical protein
MPGRQKLCTDRTEAVSFISSPVVAIRRQPFLGSARRKVLFLKVLEETRKKYDFAVAGLS